MKVYAHHKKIKVQNPNKEKGKVKVYNARTGKVLAEKTIPANGETVIESTKSDTYVVAVAVESDVETTTVLVQ